jgi:hypothetical protein
MSCVWPFYGYSILSLIRWWYWVNGFLFPLFMLFLHSYIWIYIHICKLYMILSYDLYYDRILQYLFSSQSLAISQFWLPCRAFTFIYMWFLICNLYYMSNINMSILDNIWYIVYAEPTLQEQGNIFPWTTVLFIIVFLLNQIKMTSTDTHIFMELAIQQVMFLGPSWAVFWGP